MFNTNSESVLSVLVKIECEQMQGRAGDCVRERKQVFQRKSPHIRSVLLFTFARKRSSKICSFVNLHLCVECECKLQLYEAENAFSQNLFQHGSRGESCGNGGAIWRFANGSDST